MVSNIEFLTCGLYLSEDISLANNLISKKTTIERDKVGEQENKTNKDRGGITNVTQNENSRTRHIRINDGNRGSRYLKSIFKTSSVISALC